MKKSSLLGLSLAAMLAAPALAGDPATLSLSASPTIKVGETFVLSVNIAGFPSNAVGAQATISYDKNKVSYNSIAAGDDFGMLIFQSHDSDAGTVLFASGVSPSAPTTGVTSGNIAKITLTANTVLCSADIADIVDGLFANRVTDATGTAMGFTESETTAVIALDAFTREDLWQTMHNLREEEPFTCLLITHDLRESIFLADEVVVLSGRPATAQYKLRVTFEGKRKLDDLYTQKATDMLAILRHQIEIAQGRAPANDAEAAA